MFDLGSAAHSMLLHDDRQFAIAPGEFKDWKKKDAREFKDDAYANGFIPLLEHQYENVRAMATAARAQLDAHEQMAGAFLNGQPEVTLIWREGDTWARCRLDWHHTDGPMVRVFPDYKSTGASANPEGGVERLAFNMGFEVQAAWYRRGIRAVLKIDNPTFLFVVQENTPPYALSVIGLPPAVMDLAERKVDHALELWRKGLRTNEWPGYASRIAWIEMPRWAESAWLDREIRREVDPETYERLLQWQAPMEAAE